MALLSHDMIREIRGVANAYAERERARLTSPAVGREPRVAMPRRVEDDAAGSR